MAPYEDVLMRLQRGLVCSLASFEMSLLAARFHSSDILLRERLNEPIVDNPYT
jgi:hypothetical protein